MSQHPTTSQRRMTRRRFLIGFGLGAAALSAGSPWLLGAVRLRLHQQLILGDDPKPTTPDSPFVWFEIAPDNHTTLYIPKAEMGQGIHTALAQIAADELELDWNLVSIRQADTTRGFADDMLSTFGSTSIITLYQPLRVAAATMRDMLRAEAAQQLNAPRGTVIAHASACTVTGSDRRLSYGQIVAAKREAWALPTQPPDLKPARAFTLIGMPIQRVDFHEKLTGRAIYGYDVRLPGMLYGAVARPPRYGAVLRHAAPGTAAQQPGVVQIVLADGFAGVVAEQRTVARAAVAALDLTWEGGTEISQEELERLVAVPASGGVTIQVAGDPDRYLGEPRAISAEYRTPLAAHATLEGQAALAEVTPERATIYTSTQTPAAARDAIAHALGRDASQVTVIPTYLGASFGRKGSQDVGAEAARLAAAVGRPVHVGWTMAEELRNGYLRPPSHHQLRASLDSAGDIIAFEHQLSSGDVAFHFPELLPGGQQLERLLGADPLAAFGALVQYAVPNHRVVSHRVQLPVPTSFWRGLGLLPNTFALECFMDELAHAASADPLAFRLRHLPQSVVGDRLRVVLQAAAERAGWGRPAPGRAQGIACCADSGAVVAEVAEVAVGGNAIRVHRVTCVVDAGLIVNPNGALAQVQGSVMMGLSSTLHEEITVAKGMVQQSNLDSYPLLSMREAPAIDVVFVGNGDHPIGGLGEPAIGPVSAAVANAVFTVTGQRLRRLPLRLTTSSISQKG